MPEKNKSQADSKLIQKLFNVEPLDWIRRENGDLVFLNPIGQKFIYSDDELRSLAGSKLDQHDKAAAEKKSAAAAAEEPAAVVPPPSLGADAPAAASKKSKTAK